MFMEKSFKKVMSIAVVAAVGVAPMVYAQAPRSDVDMPQRNQAPPTPQSNQGSSAQSATAVSNSDRRMMNDLAHANLAEIEAGKLAISKTKNEEIKSYAQKMINDHTEAMQKLQQLAQEKGVTLPMEPDKPHQASLKRLGDMSGEDFDRRYIAQGGVDDHKKTHRLLQRVESRAADPQLKEHATNTLPIVQQHWTIAQELQGNTSGRKSDRSSSAAGTPGYGSNR